MRLLSFHPSAGAWLSVPKILGLIFSVVSEVVLLLPRSHLHPVVPEPLYMCVCVFCLRREGQVSSTLCDFFSESAVWCHSLRENSLGLELTSLIAKYRQFGGEWVAAAAAVVRCRCFFAGDLGNSRGVWVEQLAGLRGRLMLSRSGPSCLFGKVRKDWEVSNRNNQWLSKCEPEDRCGADFECWPQRDPFY